MEVKLRRVVRDHTPLPVLELLLLICHTRMIRSFVLRDAVGQREGLTGGLHGLAHHLKPVAFRPEHGPKYVSSIWKP